MQVSLKFARCFFFQRNEVYLFPSIILRGSPPDSARFVDPLEKALRTLTPDAGAFNSPIALTT